MGHHQNAGPGQGHLVPRLRRHRHLLPLRLSSAGASRPSRTGNWPADLVADAIAEQGRAPGYLHADGGAAMTSKPLSSLLVDLDVTRSHNRPRTSNDNPYSEAQFKTMKYTPDYPERFASIGAARA